MKLSELTIKRARKTVVILISVTVLYTIYHYQCSSDFFMIHFGTQLLFKDAQALSIYYQWGMALLILGIIPALIVKFIFSERLIDYGVSFKRPLIAIFITLLGVAFVTPLVYFGARNPGLKAFYPLIQNSGDSVSLFLKSAIFNFLYYIGYEFCFRGLLFMGIKDDIGDWQAMAVSLIATALLHVQKPQPEMVMAIVAGIVFPILVRKIGSLVPCILIHAYAGISLDYWIIVNNGGF